MNCMYKIYTFIIACFLTIFSFAQTEISGTTTSSTYTTGVAGVSFAVENTNNYPILLTDLSTFWGSNSASTGALFKLYYSKTSLSGTSVISTGDWQIADSTSTLLISNQGQTRRLFSNMYLEIPANTTYRFYLESTYWMYYTTYTADPTNKYSANGVNLLTGDYQINGSYVGYTGTSGSLTTARNNFVGSITFVGNECNDPLKGGQVVSSPSGSLCSSAPVNLDLTNNSKSSSLKYQWQSSTDRNGPFVNVGSELTNPKLTVQPSATTFYRCELKCGTTVSYSDTFQLKLNTQPFAGGTYTIDARSASSNTNFRSFSEAIDAIKCGIQGAVVFNVVPGSGPYTEKVVFPEISGVSATNTITINGSNDTLKYKLTSNFESVLKFTGADYVTINNLNISSVGSGIPVWTVLYSNNSNNNTINQSKILGDTTGLVASIGLLYGNDANCFSCVNTSLTGSNNTLSNSVINGHLYSTVLNGSTTDYIANNQFLNNTFSNFGSYGVFLNIRAENTTIKGNSFTRPTRNDGILVYPLFLQGTSPVNNYSRGVNIEGNYFHNLSSPTNVSTIVTSVISINAPSIGANKNRIVNNLISNIRLTGSLTGIWLRSADNAEVYHNTVVFDDTDIITSSSVSTKGILVDIAPLVPSQLNDIFIKYNIVLFTSGGNGPKIGLEYGNTNVHSDYNVVNVDAPNGIRDQYFGTIGVLSKSTLKDWQNQFGKDLHSFDLSPDFEDTNAGNYKPTVGLINNAAENLGVPSDISGTARTTTPDPGAFEFAPKANVLDAAVEWSNPVAPVASGSNAIKVKIYNTQTTAINTLDLAYSDGTNTISETFTNLSLESGKSTIITFTNLYNITSSVELIAYIRSVNGIKDVNSKNDTTATQSICIALPAGTYTINANQATGAGNYSTFADAVAALKCGVAGPVNFDVVKGSGPYKEQVLVPTVLGTSATNTITFNGNGEMLNPVTNTTVRYAFLFNNVKHVVLKDLIINTVGSTITNGLQFINYADSNVVEACTILADTLGTGVSNFAIVFGGTANSNTSNFYGGSYNLIKNNTIKGGYNSIYYGGTFSKQNKFINNDISEFYVSGINLNSAFQVTLESNKIHRIRRANSNPIVVGINVDGYNNIINKNRIYDLNKVITNSDASGIKVVKNTTYTPTVDSNVITNNLLYNLIGYGIHIADVANTLVYNNTISFDNTGSSTNYGIYQTGIATGIKFYNNLITLSRAGISHGLFINSDNKTLLSNYNNVIGDENNGLKYFGHYNGASFLSLADWKTANGAAFDSKSYSIEPMYTDSINGNYKPKNAELDNKGEAVVVIDVIENIGRAIPPDIGAYEFGTALPVTLVSFNGQSIGNNVSLSWLTTTESDFSHFIVEKSLNGTDFKALIRTNTKGAGSYTETDNNAFADAATLYYRLKIVDLNGQFSYSEIIVVKQTGGYSNSVSVYPNPVQGNNVWLKLQSTQTGKVAVKVVDFSGRIILTQNSTVVAGSNVILLSNFKQLTTGMYSVIVELNNERFITKIVK